MSSDFGVSIKYIHIYIYIVYTVWPEILAGRYFGGLLKICHLAEFTLAVDFGVSIKYGT